MEIQLLVKQNVQYTFESLGERLEERFGPEEAQVRIHEADQKCNKTWMIGPIVLRC